MKYYIHITRQPLSDIELLTAIAAIVKVPAPHYAHARAIRDLIPLLPVSQFEAQQRGYSNHTPVIIGPEVPGDGFDKKWSLHWREYPDATPSPVPASRPSAPAAVPPPAASVQTAQASVPPPSSPAAGILVRLWRFLFGR